MNGRQKKSRQGKLFLPERPTNLLNDKRREVLIPLLSMIIAVTMTTSDAAPDSRTLPGAGHDE